MLLSSLLTQTLLKSSFLSSGTFHSLCCSVSWEMNSRKPRQLRVFQVLQMLRPRSESLPLCFSRALCITSYNQKATPSPWVSLEVYRKVVHVGSLNVWEARAAVWLVRLSHLQRVDRTGMQGKLNRWQTYAVSVLRAWNLCRACGAGCQSHGDPTNLPFSIPRGSLVWSARSFHLGSESFLVLFKMEARL